MNTTTTAAGYRTLTDDELSAMYGSSDDTAQAAILREMARRDRAARTHAADVKRWEATYAAWHDFAYAQYLAAEAETRGYLLNKAGIAAGIDPWTLWSGSDAQAMRYASEELRNFWDCNRRLTVSQYHRQMRRERRIAREQHADEQ